MDHDLEVVRSHSDSWSTSGLTGMLASWKAGSMGGARQGGRFDNKTESQNVRRLNEFCSSGEGRVQD